VPAEVVEGQAYSTGGVDYQALFYLIKQRWTLLPTSLDHSSVRMKY
jgi:hypothetical protein